MRLFLALWLALSPAVGAKAQTMAPRVTDPDVALGIRHVDEGDYDEAIQVLDAAARRLAQQKAPSQVLSQAYLYLGIAYLAKGHETSAKARFRDALAQVHDLQVTPESFAPRVVEMFERAREELRAAPNAPVAVASPPPAKKGGGSGKLLLIGGGLAAAGAIAVAAGGGGGSTATPGDGRGAPRQTSFPNEVVRAGAGRDFVVTSAGSGPLTARLSYSPAGVVLSMYIVALSNAAQVLADANQSGAGELTLTLPVTAQAYRISVTHSSGQGPQVDATFTLNVTHP